MVCSVFSILAFTDNLEYIEFMGGVEGPMWEYFKVSLIRGFLELRKHYDKIVGLIEMMMKTHLDLPSLKRGEPIIHEVCSRFCY
jgi:hypothetical protein